MSELKPCPFCGHEASVGYFGSHEITASCDSDDDCPGRAGSWSHFEDQPEEKAKNEVITAWNTRTPDPRVMKLVEAIRSPIGEYDMDQSDDDVLSDRVKVLEAHIENIERALSAFNGDGK